MSIFANELANASAEDVALLKEYFTGYDYHGAGYTFIANYIWRNSYCVSWEIIEGYLCIAGAPCNAPNGMAFMAMPLTRTSYDKESLRRAIIECKTRFDSAGKEFMFTSIPGEFRGILREAFGEGNIEFVHEVDFDEYVYLKEKLITLSGRALHKKKNHLNFFLRNFEYEARPLADYPGCRDEVMELTARIKEFKSQDPEEIDDLEGEYEAIEQILTMLDEPNVRGVGIYINDKLEAFALGEVISDAYAAEHFEKANGRFRGLYQLVLSEYCKALPESVIYVNREEDMGLPNLRQAKEALKPEYMEERFTAIIDQGALMA